MSVISIKDRDYHLFSEIINHMFFLGFIEILYSNFFTLYNNTENQTFLHVVLRRSA